MEIPPLLVSRLLLWHARETIYQKVYVQMELGFDCHLQLHL